MEKKESIKYSIVIVTWNGLKHLKRFLPEVMQCKHPSFEVIIADNNSSDGTAEWLAEYYPQAIHAKFDNNYGYCGGNNRALPYCKGDYVIFLNNDATAKADWLDKLDEAVGDTNYWAWQPKILAYERPDEFEYAGAAGGFMDAMGYPFCRGRIMDIVEKDEGQYNSPSPIFWASGAALVFRKEKFEQLGGFPEEYEFHMEEIDLCWRVWNAGGKVGYIPQSVVYHLGGGSLPMGSPRKVYYNFRNNLFMLTRNHFSSALFPLIFKRLCLDGIAAIRSLSQGKIAELAAVFKAHMHYYRALPRLLKERKQIRTNSVYKSVNWSSIRWDKWLIKAFFIDGKKTFNDLDF